MSPESVREFLSARIAIDTMAFGLLQPLFGAEEGIEVERKAWVDSFGFDVDRVEEIGLPTEVKPMERNDGNFEIGRRVVGVVCAEGPQSMLAVNDFDRRNATILPLGVKTGRK